MWCDPKINGIQAPQRATPGRAPRIRLSSCIFRTAKGRARPWADAEWGAPGKHGGATGRPDCLDSAQT